MNNIRKLARTVGTAAVIAAMTASMVAPAFAATNTKSVIDENRSATLNIHKIIENDGTLKNADGTAVEGDYVPVNNVGFDYVKLAGIRNVTGILVSDADGAIDLNAGGGEVSVGTYYVASRKLEKLFAEAGQVVPAVYLKQFVSGSEEATLQYQWADNVANHLLASEQENVDQKKAALDRAASDLKNARNRYYSENAQLSADTSTKANLDRNLAKLNTSAADAAAAVTAARDAAASAGDEFIAASDRYDAASDALDTAVSTFEADLGRYQSGSGEGLADLRTAREELKEAAKRAKEASEKFADAAEAQRRAAAGKAAAEAAKNAAQAIREAAEAAQASAATGTHDSATGTKNAVDYARKQYENANAYYEAMTAAAAEANTKLSAAEEASEAADSALDTAQQKVETVASNNTAAYNAFKNSLAALTAAQNEKAAAQQAKIEARAKKSAADTALSSAQGKKAAADALAAQAQTDASNAAAAKDNQQAITDTAKTTLEGRQSAYDSALSAYQAAVAALDTKAEANGIGKVYTAEGLEKAMQKVITTLGEERVNRWVLKNAPTQDDANPYSSMGFGEKTGQRAEGYTDDNGTVTFSGMDLGLYIVAETDISYHDGYAGAWNDDPAGGHINNDQMNTYHAGSGTYSITPINGWNQETVHTYQEGELYRESYNPEGPVLESLAAPFLVSLPTTNTTDTTDGAAGDNTGKAGTVWQYTVDVYPKNQSTAIYKRIVDPDEDTGNETLRTSEDYQIGDKIEQVIWADAPVLQKNYLFDSSDEGFGDGPAGDVSDRPESDAANRHLGYVISDTMTKGLTFEGVTRVSIIPKYQLSGTNQATTVYTDGNGTVVPASEALDGSGALKTTVHYYDQNEQEITKRMFETRTGVTNPEFKNDIDNTGTDVGTGKTYPAKSGLTGTYYATRISYKQIEIASGSAAIPNKSSAFDPAAPVTQGTGANTQVIAGAGETLAAGTDYEVIADLTSNQVTLMNAEGDEEVVVPMITDENYHGFAVKLTEAGLVKLNARTEDSVVVVYFDSILNKDATIGQVAQNMNYPTLSWVNTNSSFRTIRGNEVYDYTYELQLKKKGVLDGRNVKFIVSRDDREDFAQVSAKDLTDTVSRERNYGAEDSIRFVKEADGIYHVWGFISGEAESDSAISGAENGPETATVNGVACYTVTPAKNGSLILKGLDSNDYIFKEIQTEDENNLLKEEFIVSLRANDNTASDALSSLRDGRLKSAAARTGSGAAATDITIGVSGVTDGQDVTGDVAKNLGIASMEVNNFDAIDLRTGGRGTFLLYTIGAALAAGAGIGIAASRRKNKKAEQ